MRGKWIAAAALAVALIVGLMVSKRMGMSETTQSPSVVETAKQTLQPNEEKREPATVITNGAPKPGLPQPADPAFQQWLADEAKAVDLPHVDAQAKQEQIQQIVSKLTPAQSRQLLQTASNPIAPPGEKILSTYLLVQGGFNSREELKAFIAAPLKEQGAHEPHSESEINGVREKSLRIMAIDGLFSQAKNDPQAKAALAAAIASSDDPYIKAYAQRKLDELSRQ